MVPYKKKRVNEDLLTSKVKADVLFSHCHLLHPLVNMKHAVMQAQDQNCALSPVMCPKVCKFGKVWVTTPGAQIP